MNRRQLAKAQTRARIITAAQKLWAEPGSYAGGTIRDIANAAGMSTGAIFANFEGKEDLWRVAMGYEPPIDSAEVRAALRAAAQPVLAEAA
jgi:AcrR family transcriptional regulator